jgi:hypothetical protein
LIEEQENITNAINDSNEKLLNKMQKSIDENRAVRSREEGEREIEDKYSELAYL